MSPERKKKITLWIISVAAAIIVIFLGLGHLGTVADAFMWCVRIVMPLIVGIAIALVVNVPMRFFESILFKKCTRPRTLRLRRPLAYVISLLLILCLLAGIIGLVIPHFVEAISAMVYTVKDIITRFSAMSDEEIRELPLGEWFLNVDWDEILTRLTDWLKNEGTNILGTAFGTISSVVTGVIDFFISFVFSVYVLFNKEKLKALFARGIRVWLPKRFGEWSLHAFSLLSKNFRNFIFGQSLEALILGTLCTIGMLILQLPYAPAVGAMVGVTALIPVIGCYIGAAAGALLIVTVSPIKLVIFLAYLIILQQIEGNIIYPKVIGSKVKLPAMWILAAVTIGGGIAGTVGMLVGVPVAATVYQLVREATDARAKKLGLDECELTTSAIEPENTEIAQEPVAKNNDGSEPPTP